MLIETFLLFLVTTFVVIVSPGPAVITVTVEAATNGFKQAFWVFLGVAIANVVFFMLSAMGIVTLIIASSLLFTLIKWAGVAYLLYLGFSAFFSNAGGFNVTSGKKKKSRFYKVFMRGFILEISNPKALLYFSALLPQFINVAQPIVPQLVIFCSITFLLDLFCYSCYAYLGCRSRRVAMKPFAIKLINKVAGSLLIFAGLKMATFES